MQRVLWQSGKSLPKKRKEEGEKKNRTQQKRLPKNYETLSDIPKKDKIAKLKYLYIPTWAICGVGSPHDTSIFALLPRPPIPARPCWTISIRRGSCNPGFIYLLIHRIPQRSFHLFFTTQKFPPPIHRDSFIPCPPGAAPSAAVCTWARAVPGLLTTVRYCQLFESGACNLPRLMSHVKTNYRPPCLLKEKNKPYLLPTCIERYGVVHSF
jgi:hypothetical protein